MGNPQVYDKLTPKQGELLAGIAALAKRAGGEPVVQAHRTKDGAEILATTDRVDVYRYESHWLGAQFALGVFEELELIHMDVDAPGESEFWLRQGALDYARWHKLPGWIRWLHIKWDSWESDVRGGIVTIAVSVLASLAISLLTNWVF
jgi:hypothetical protein